MATEVERLRGRLTRERQARRQAERIAEQTTRALYEEVAERTRELESVVAMGRDVGAALDSSAVGDLIARHIAAAVGLDECGIYAWERAEVQVRTIGYHPPARREILEDVYSLVEYPETLRVLESRQLSIIDPSDPTADSSEVRFLRSLGGSLMFQIPMIVNQQAIGTVEVLSRQGTLLNDRQTAIAQTMANEAGVLFENARLYAQIRHQAFYDHLTGLPNRALFGDRVSHALARRSEERSLRSAILFVDIDDFKDVNDRHGHEVGDHVLAAAAARLRALLRAGDTVARLSGDEFGILVEDISERREASAIAARVVRAFERPLELAQQEVKISVSVGLDIESTQSRDAETLIRNADFAMYRAKQSGKGRHRVYRPTERAEADHGVRLRADLRGAAARAELRLHYQPIVDLQSGDTVAFEALVRWMHPEHGLIGPSAFIPIAEEIGVIDDIGEWVLQAACSQLRTWLDLRPDLAVTVNLSARQLHSARFVEQVREAIRLSRIEPKSLILEVTESILASEAAEAMLRQVKAIGVRLAVDDFGTGYSSISYLRRFPIDILKIDREFTKDIVTPNGEALFRGIVQLGRSLGLVTVAEGIEDAEQQARVTAASCDRGQGYVFAVPSPPEEIVVALTPRARASRQTRGRAALR